jgi:phytoene synthase
VTDRDLVRLYWPVELRPAFDALFGIDDALAEVVTSSTQPALGAIRLAWWREALERLDTNSPPPEPRLQAVASELKPRGISAKDLAALEDGWATLLDEVPDVVRIGNRGATLFRIAAKLLGGDDRQLEDAGRLFAIGQVTRNKLTASEIQSPPLAHLAAHRFPRALRPITAFARLAARDLQRVPAIEPEATPGRAAALLRHRLFGTLG